MKYSLKPPPKDPSCLRCATPKKCAVHGCSPNTWPPEKKPVTMDWRTPTDYRTRFVEAVTLLCGKSPTDELVDGWIDGSSDELQSFAAQHGPSWAQGIVLLDAAHVLAETPVEGVQHLDPEPTERPAVLFNPYTGERRDLRDVESDPYGALIVESLRDTQRAALAAPMQEPEKLDPLTQLQVAYVMGLRDANSAVQTAPMQEPDRTGMRYYRNDKCTAEDAHAPDCICWTPEAAQPRKAVKLTSEQLLDIFAGEKPTLRDVTLCRAIEAAVLKANGVV